MGKLMQEHPGELVEVLKGGQKLTVKTDQALFRCREDVGVLLSGIRDDKGYGMRRLIDLREKPFRQVLHSVLKRHPFAGKGIHDPL